MASCRRACVNFALIVYLPVSFFLLMLNIFLLMADEKNNPGTFSMYLFVFVMASAVIIMAVGVGISACACIMLAILISSKGKDEGETEDGHAAEEGRGKHRLEEDEEMFHTKKLKLELRP